MKNILFIAFVICLVSCNNNENNFVLNGNIKGLKKGTVYLLKANDSTFTTLDSIEIKGNPEFTLSTNLDEPEVLFVKLDKKHLIVDVVFDSNFDVNFSVFSSHLVDLIHSD